MSVGEASVFILSDDEDVSPPVPVVDLKMAAEETMELDSTPEDLTIVRRDSPQAVRPLSIILLPVQVASSSGRDVLVAPPIRADDEEEMTEEDIPLNIRARSPGVFFGERDQAEREYVLFAPNVPTLVDEEEAGFEEEEAGSEEEEIVGRGNGEEPLQTNAAILIAEGSSNQATLRKRVKSSFKTLSTLPLMAR